MTYLPTQDLVTGSGSLTAATQTVTLTGLRGTGDATISITGTWAGTLTIQGSIDGGTTYASINAVEVDTFTVYQSATWSRNAQLRVNSIAGLSHLRVYATVLSSGTAVVSVRATNSSATNTTLNYLSLASDTPQFAARDAFGRSRTAQPQTLFDCKFLFDKQPLLWDETTTGGAGGGTFTAAEAYVRMATAGAGGASNVIRQTYQSFNYQPGKGQLLYFTFCFTSTGTSGITRRVGQFNANNGVFLAQTGTTVSVNIRTQSAYGNQSVNQSSWNWDKMDGTGPSRITIDWSKAQILVIDYEWLGVGSVRFGFVIDGSVYYVHQFRNANVLSGVYMSTPNLPLRYSIDNDGTAAAANFDQICSSVITEGGRSDLGQHFAIDTGLTLQNLPTVDTEYLMLAMRLQTGRSGAFIVPSESSVVSDITSAGAVTVFRWRLLKNPTITGNALTYNAVTNSSLEYAINAVQGGGAGVNVITAGTGTCIAAGVLTEKNSSIELPNLPDIAFGMSIGGTADVFVIGVTWVNGATASNAAATFGWSEVT